MPDGWQWLLTRETVDGHEKVFVQALRDRQPTKYYGRIDIGMHGDTAAPIGLAADIKQRILRDLPKPTPNNLAKWLATNIHAIANNPHAHVCYAEVKQAITDIDKVINRPETQQYCGPCPTLSEDNTPCKVGLFAKRDDTEIQCWKCKTTHNIEQLIQQALETVKELGYTAEEILGFMADIGQPIPPSTWRKWRAEGKIQPRSHRGDTPLYWISDIRALADRKPQKAKTGAAAHKKQTS